MHDSTGEVMTFTQVEAFQIRIVLDDIPKKVIGNDLKSSEVDVSKALGICCKGDEGLLSESLVEGKIQFLVHLKKLRYKNVE